MSTLALSQSNSSSLIKHALYDCYLVLQFSLVEDLRFF